MTALLPGATLGIIGGGQLARMMILEARTMGYRTCVLSPSHDDPAVSVADEWVVGALDDARAAARLARCSDVVTMDTEHVPADVLRRIEDQVLVRPSPSVFETVQDRRAQRAFLDRVGIPQPRCVPIRSIESLREEAAALGFSAVLKSSHAGYDGRGQAVIRGSQDLASAWEKVGRRPAVLEEWVDFDFEISVLLARNPAGEVRFYPLALNAHRHQVLRTTMAPAPVGRGVETEVREIAERIAGALDHVGMMAVEMFVVDGSSILVNEIAPRPHNSGHFTFGACVTSQFEQHVRGVLGLPLGDTLLPQGAAMVNLFGDLWREGEPDWTGILSTPEARLHLYGKQDPRPGRKMGHVLIVHRDPFEALRTGEALLEELHGGPSVERAPRNGLSCAN
ncbi:MAG: 5-(carboxyamino)imidazole ribonucleotide synthase [Polyangiales bacterium]